MALTELIARVEAATGPNWEIDRDVHLTIFGPGALPDVRVAGPVPPYTANPFIRSIVVSHLQHALQRKPASGGTET